MKLTTHHDVLYRLPGWRLQWRRVSRARTDLVMQPGAAPRPLMPGGIMVAGGRGWILVLVAVLISGCGLSARDALMRAEARWHKATGIVEPWPAVLAESYGRFQCVDIPKVMGCYNYTTDTVTLNLLQTDAGLEQTAVHEWGHKLGVSHAKNAGAVMSKSLSAGRRCITPTDVRMVCSIRDCLWERPECL